MLVLPSSPLGKEVLSKDELKNDKATAEHYEDCGLGQKAIYLPKFFIGRLSYVPISSVTKVYKRLAVSKGFFEEGKIYGTLSYLVISFDGMEKVFRFTHEEVLDAFLEAIKTKTSIPVGK